MIAILNPQNIFLFLVMLATVATIISIFLPYMAQDRMADRMKAMAVERDKMRAQRMSELTTANGIGLRQRPKEYMLDLIERYGVQAYFNGAEIRRKLRMAGLRGESPYVSFLFFKAIAPLVGFIAVAAYMFVVEADTQLNPAIKIGACFFAGYIGFIAPNVFVSNLISKRQTSISRAFPDALDLLLICVQSGMSVEAAFNRVSREVAGQSVELAEEFALTTAELSYLPERRQAYENMGARIGLAPVKATATSLIQSERYGSPVAQALRVMAKENRDLRMLEAERKAAALPPKLTVPMIVFFLPVLFVVILGPGVVQALRLKE
ncbi:MAG: type II secretion system F family protein [Pseudomonadota bacterium]